MAEAKRFEIVDVKSSKFFSDTQIIVDKETRVQYLFVQHGYSGGLTVLLGADGKPLLAHLD